MKHSRPSWRIPLWSKLGGSASFRSCTHLYLSHCACIYLHCFLLLCYDKCGGSIQFIDCVITSCPSEHFAEGSRVRLGMNMGLCVCSVGRLLLAEEECAGREEAQVMATELRRCFCRYSHDGADREHLAGGARKAHAQSRSPASTRARGSQRW